MYLEDELAPAAPVVEALLRGRPRRAGALRRWDDGPGTPTRPAETQAAARDLLALPGGVKVELGIFEAWPGQPEAEELLAAHGGPQGIEGWVAFDPLAFAASWLPAAARAERWSFYFAHASQRPRRRLSQRLVHRLARARVRTGFYGLDLERRAVLGLRRARKALRLEPPTPVED